MVKSFLLSCVFLISCFIASGQLNLLPQNLNSIRSADISEDQLSQITAQMKLNNVTSAQVYQLAIQRGMLATEAKELKSRIDNLSPQNQSVNTNPVTNDQTINTEQQRPRNTTATDNTNTREVLNPKKIFGFEIFNNGVMDFNPDVKIATPANYIIGPDDEIALNIYGYQEARYNLRVSAEGSINIPLVGIMYVSGLTIEQATAKIKSKLAANGYANIRTGLTKVDVNIGRIRSIRVTVLGEVRTPGRYTLSSLSNAFNALYLSGGPNDIGSMRLIEIIRNGKIIDRLDIYDFLVHGDPTGSIVLQDQDIIRVPPYRNRVSLEGEVKHTGLFEVLPGENLEKILDFAGGFTDSAYTASIKSYKVTDTARRIFDINKEQFKNYTPSRAESFVIRRIINRVTNRVTIKGAVFLPGEYELTEGMTLIDLIRKAQGLREDAYRERGLIIRYNADMTTQLVQFSPGTVLNNGQNNLKLNKNDEVTISSIFDIKENFNVTITGEVRRPGTFTYTPNITLKDVILLSGGFTDAAAPQRIEIARRIKRDTIAPGNIDIAQVIEVNSAADLNTIANDIKLQPWDAIQVRRSPGYSQQINASIEGEVLYPGPYVITNKNERVSDLINRAGGITSQAYKKGAFITRINRSTVVKDVGIKQVQRIQKEVDDSSNVILDDIVAPTVKVAVNIERILANPHTDEDLTLQEGDIINITKEIFEVKVNGEVMFPTQIVFKEGADLRYYIDKAGGFTDDARKKRTYVLYGNGNAAKTRRFLLIKSYPAIEPGAEILVPKVSDRRRSKLTSGEILALSSGVTAVVGMVIALLNYLK